MNNDSKKTMIGPVIFLIVFILVCIPPVLIMGLANMLNTMMNTAYRLLIDTCFYIMAIAVLAGAVSELFAEFGILELLNRILSPLMRPLWGMPGASALGIVSTYLSDNPAILTLADNREYRKYFKAYQIPALTNLGTAFGMGLIVTSCMLGLSTELGVGLGKAVLCGNLGAVIGSIISTRLMLVTSKKHFGNELSALDMPGAPKEADASDDPDDDKTGKKQGAFLRFLNSLLRGGKVGVEMGLGIVPGVCVICTLVMMLTNGPSEAGVYTGAAYEGIRVLPWIGDKLRFILTPLFGFTSSECVSVPITALGSAGAALSTVKTLAASGSIGGGDIAVFTAMCMCWSGYLSTHCSMMDMLHCRRFVGKSILFHTIGGLCAGIAAHFLFLLIG